MTVKQLIQESIDVKTKILSDEVLLETIERIGEELKHVYGSKGKLMIAGNGGSAADAQHFAAEITCQFLERRKGRSALALSTDTSALTAWSNDHSYESVFSRLVEALGVAGDALVVISTSGNSKNLIQAAITARKMGIKVYGLLGHEGGSLRELCDLSVVVPSKETPRIQESHILVIHILCGILDEFFFHEDSSLSPVHE
ncbi:MAG: SIS domain-containing protein [Minisyncoccia bacterium]